MNLKEFLNYRPMSVLAICAGLRDVLLGIGFLVGLEQITGTLIYQNYDELVPGISGPVTGGLFVVVGLITILSTLILNRSGMSAGLKVQSLAWLFSTLMYLLNGHFLLAGIFGIFFMIPSGYIGYYVKHHPPPIIPKKERDIA